MMKTIKPIDGTTVKLTEHSLGVHPMHGPFERLVVKDIEESGETIEHFWEEKLPRLTKP